MIKIDSTDKKISDLLLEDGRMSCSHIAARIGDITERAVRYRIKRLIKNRIISIRGNVNAVALGMIVCADVFIEVELSRLVDIANTLASYESISYIAYATGDTDISIQVYARNNSDVFDFVTEVIGQIPGVRKTHISYVPNKLKDDQVWPIPPSLITNT